MTIKGAQEQPALFRGQQREHPGATKGLWVFLCSKGTDPDPPSVDLTERNTTLYNRYGDGPYWEAIAKSFHLAKERVNRRLFCRRVTIKKDKRAKKEAGEAVSTREFASG